MSTVEHRLATLAVLLAGEANAIRTALHSLDAAHGYATSISRGVPHGEIRRSADACMAIADELTRLARGLTMIPAGGRFTASHGGDPMPPLHAKETER
jgi:hypothetical protein